MPQQLHDPTFRPQAYIIASSSLNILVIKRRVMISVDGGQTGIKTREIPSQIILYLVIGLYFA